MERIVVVTNPMPKNNRSSEVTINKLLSIILESVESTILLGGNLAGIIERQHLYIRNVAYKNSDSKLIKILYYLLFQIKMFFIAMNLIRKDDEVFFWIADKMILPFFAAKLKQAKVNYFLYGNVGIEGSRSRITALSEKVILYMANHADHICVESPSVIKQWKIKKNKADIRIIHLYVDNCVAPRTQGTPKNNTVGMICRLTEGKRVLESIHGFNEFYKKFPEWKLQIVGNGKLFDKCVEKIDGLQAKNHIQMLGWIEHEHIADITSTWILLLLPTDTEGLPNALIESMVQYTPALASPVGGICDIIIDGKNGWLLSESTAEEIAKGLERALYSNNYEMVSLAAYHTIENQFSFVSSVENFKEQICFVDGNEKTKTIDYREHLREGNIL
ncbi:MAG: glycosyltransferase [Peptococcaceae bacterium]|nr:glycosyltransferase [Peptococcaceae bacterium]